MREIHVSVRSLEPFVPLVGAQRVRALEQEARNLRELLGGSVIWNVSSTAAGGGVAEMLRALLRYTRALGVDVRWLVLEGPPAFFRVTKRLHNALHSSRGNGSELGDEAHAIYEAATDENARAIDALVRRGDIVICHDPQTAGLVHHLLKRGARTIWRCHIGHEEADDEVQRGWTFLRRYLAHVPIAIFTREAYAPPWLRGKRTVVLPPHIDPFSAKNQEMDAASVRGIVEHAGLVAAGDGPRSTAFLRDDGSSGRVDRAAVIVREGPPPSYETPIITQVSRWDAMKDPVGVLRGFAELMGLRAPRNAALVLAGPWLDTIADDPEASAVYDDVERAWRALPESARRAVTIARLPMQDLEENAAIVNALQRHATIVVQKSLEEGFGLTVTEAMWKRRAVIASAVGGIQDQIRDGIDGILLRDPRDPLEFAGALARVLDDPGLAARLGDSAQRRVRESFLAITALERWAAVVQLLLAPSATTAAAPALSSERRA